MILWRKKSTLGEKIHAEPYSLMTENPRLAIADTNSDHGMSSGTSSVNEEGMWNKALKTFKPRLLTLNFGVSVFRGKGVSRGVD